MVTDHGKHALMRHYFKISLEILLTVSPTILMMSVLRICFWTY